MRWCTWWVLVTLVVGARVASAESAADALVREAERLGAAGDFVGAANKFREAHRLDPRPPFLCNVGVAYYNANEDLRAHRYLGECLKRATALDAALASQLQTALATVEGRLRAGEFAMLDLVVEPATAIVAIDVFDADETLVGSRVVWVPAGPHKVAVSAEGFVPQQLEVTLGARDRKQVHIVLKRERPPTPVEPTPALEPGPDVGTQRSRTPAIAVTALTVVVGATAVFAYVRARGLADDAGATTLTMVEYDQLVDRTRTWQHTAWGLAGVAAVAAVASGYLWYRSSLRVEIEPSPRGGRVSLAGSW